MAHAVRRLCTLANPVVDARQIELQLLLAPARNRIEKAHVLQARAALALAAVGDDDVIEGLVARPAPRQTNGYHDRIALVRRASRKGRPKKSADSTQPADPAPVFLIHWKNGLRPFFGHRLRCRPQKAWLDAHLFRSPHQPSTS